MKQKKIIKISMLVLVFVGISTGAFLCFRNKSDATKTDITIQKITKVSPVYTTLIDQKTNFGTISWSTKHDITAQVAGVLEVLNVRDGDKVSLGKNLAQLKNIHTEIRCEQCKNAVGTALIARDIANVQYWETKLAIENKMLLYEQAEVSLDQKRRELENARYFLTIQTELASIGGVTENTIRENELVVMALKSQVQNMEHDLKIASLGLRNTDLLENGVTPSGNLDEWREQIINLNTRRAKAQLASTETLLKNAQRELEGAERLVAELSLIAPITGIVGAHYHEQGEYIQENEKVLTIIDTRRVLAVFPVQEKDISAYVLGKKIQIEIPSIQKNVYTVVSEISPMADPGSGNFTVKAEITNTTGEIIPGMFIQCSINRREPQKFLTIPETALVTGNKNPSSVFCVVNGLAVCNEISIHDTRDGLIWISEGLTEDSIVIDFPSLCLQEGQNVQ